MDVDPPLAAGAAPPNQRLMIREMVLENFKSYAGEQRVGPFHKVRGVSRRAHPAMVLILRPCLPRLLFPPRVTPLPLPTVLLSCCGP